MARPKGSRTQGYPFLKQIPAVCRVCGSDELNAVSGYDSVITQGGGVTSDGFEFVRIERQLRQCECGQRFIVMSYVGPPPPVLSEEKKTTKLS